MKLTHLEEKMASQMMVITVNKLIEIYYERDKKSKKQISIQLRRI